MKPADITAITTLGVLVHNASWQHDGLANSAHIVMEHKQLGSVQELLRDLANGIDPHDVDQLAFLSELLLAIAQGIDVRAALDIPPATVGHRHRDPLAPAIYASVQALSDADPVRKGRKGRACKTVGRMIGKDAEAVRKSVAQFEAYVAAARKSVTDVERKHKRPKLARS